MKLLVAGWFSFEQMGASAGDLLARDLLCDWLGSEGYNYDIAVASPFKNGISWKSADPLDYTAVIFVCGPFGNGPPLTDFFPHFAGIPLIGINLTMLQDLKEWNPFDLLLERDSSEMSRPDLVFLAERSKVPVVGLILVHKQEEYGNRGMHVAAEEALKELIDSREMAVVPIDTRLDINASGLRTSAEVESLIGRMDLVITTRLHGMVLAIKNGVPPLVVDPIGGGAKIIRQARAIKWPVVITADSLDKEKLQLALDFCLSPEGRKRTLEARNYATKSLFNMREHLLQSIESLMQAGR
jgi:polysaccharide pyruvyl transferase